MGAVGDSGLGWADAEIGRRFGETDPKDGELRECGGGT
jgi:hypothetical protein